MSEKDHAMDNKNGVELSTRPEIHKTGGSEYTIDVTNCHGSGLERGDLSVPNPYAAPGQPAVTTIGGTRGVISNGIEEALVQAGGLSTVGSKVAFKIVGAVPDMVLNVVVSMEDEGVVQATVTSAIGAGVTILVTSAMGSTGVLAPVAPIIGAVAGDFANTTADWVWREVAVILDQATGDIYDVITGSEEEILRGEPQTFHSSNKTISYDVDSGTLLSDLPLESNLEIIDSLQRQGYSVDQLEGGDGINLDNIGDGARVEVLYHDDGSPAVVNDPANQWSIEYDTDGGGVVHTGASGNQEAIPFNPDDTVLIDCQPDAGCRVSVSSSTAGDSTNDNDAPTDQIIHTYTIQPGDTLSDIARQYHTSVENLLFFNPEIEDPDMIRSGDELNIPPEDWQMPPLEPMTDADGDPILLASADPAPAGPATGVPVEPESDAARQQDFVEAKHEAIIRGGELNVQQAETGLRDAIDSGDGVRIAQEGLGYVSAMDDYQDALFGEKNGFIDPAAEAAMDGLEHGLGLGLALDSGDGLEIAANGVDLLRDIDQFVEASGGDFLDNSSEGYANLASAGLGLAAALDSGDGWEIASSLVETVEGIDVAITDTDGGSGAVGGAASAVGLAVNIASLDDAFSSGDTLQMGYTVASTVNNAIGTYNAVASMAETTPITMGASDVPVLGYVAAAIQLVEGDVKDAAVTAASAYLMTIPVYGWAAAAVLQVANMLGLFGSDDPPSATVTFSLGEDGAVAMDAHGDSEMMDAARGYGSMLTGVLQGYHDSGGRLVVDGTMPSLVVEAGSDPKICYTSEYGGSVTIGAGDPARIGVDMYGALVARDMGGRVDEAVRMATDETGTVDDGQVEAYLASLGFVRRGITWTHGETTSRMGHVTGYGGPHGGGNADGPEGEHFTARDEDITSLPLEEDQLPGQKVGRVLRTVSLNQNFAGAGSMLLAMGLGLEADHAVAAARPAVEAGPRDGLPAVAVDSEQPGAGADPALEPGRDTAGPPQDSPLVAAYTAAAAGGDDETLHTFLATLRPGMVSGHGLPGFDAPPVPERGGPAGNGDAFWQAPIPEISRPIPDETTRDFPREAPHATLQPATDSWPGNVEPPRPVVQPAAQPADHHDPTGAPPAEVRENPGPEPEQPPLPPGVEQGRQMAVDQDTSLVFLPAALAGEDAGDTAGYSQAGEQPVLVELGKAEHGTVSLDGDGTVRFVPEPGFTGMATFEYTLENPDGSTTTYRSGVLVRDVDDAPQAADDHPVIGEGEVFFVDGLLANDTDADGDTLRIDHFRGLEHSELAMVDGRLAIVPEPGFTGDIEFRYWVTDGNGYPGMASATLTVTDRNLGVAASEDRFLVLEDHALVTTADELLANDREFDGEGFGITAVSGAAHGQVSMDADGTITFVPDTDYAGDDAGFSYTIKDDSGNLSQGRVTVEVQNLRDAPRIIAESLEGIGDNGTVALDHELMARFVTDADGDAPRFEAIDSVTGGRVEYSGGTPVFIADPDGDGHGSFDYQVGDGHGGTVQGHLEFTLAATAGEGEGDDLDGLAGDSGPESPVPEQGVSPAGGDAESAAVPEMDSPGRAEVIPAAGEETGETGEETGIPAMADPDGETAAATVTGTDSGNGPEESDTLQDAIIAGPDLLETLEETPVTTSVDELLANDTALEGDVTFAGLGRAAHGQVSMDEDGAITFVPDTDYAGDGAGFTYLVSDGQGNQAEGEVGIHVENINDAPEILNDRLLINEDNQISFSADELARFVADADQDTLSFTGLDAEHGTFEVEDGTVTFVPEQDFHGVTWFDYLVSDGQGGETGGRMRVEIAPVNDLPTVEGIEADMAEDGEISFGLATLMAGAVDVEDGTDLEFDGITASRYGDAWLDRDGTVHFLPDDDFFGNAWFEYGVRDSEGGTGTGRVSVAVDAENDAPVAVADSGLAAWGNNGHDNVFDARSLLGNDYDVDLDPLRITALGEAEHGHVSLDPEGRIHYRAATDGWVGVDRFTYTVDDGQGGRAEATAEVDVRLNMEPDAYSELLESREDTVLMIDQEELLANDSDLDGDSLFITGVGGAEHGTVSLLADGTVRFAPELNYNSLHPGQAGFDYTISDGISDPVTCRALVDLAPVNDAPILRGETLRGAVEDNTFSFTPAQLLANDTDVEAASAYEDDSLALLSIGNAGHGTLAWDAAGGRIIYTPRANFNGTDTFSYQVTDSHGAVREVSSRIVVEAVNDNPVVRYDRESGAETAIWNRYRISDLLRNDHDVDGDSLHISHARVTSGHGHARISGGYLEVMPDVGQHRLEVSYDVTDGHGGSTGSRLTLDHIREHNFAPEFTGLYQEHWGRWGAGELWFAFQVHDRNGDSYAWGTAGGGDIASISAANVHGGSIAYWPNDNSSFRFEGDIATGGCTLTATDHQGASGTIRISFSHFRGVTGQYVYSPVVLDLDGDGVELVSIDDGVEFDWNRDGEAEATGWVAPDDGLLVYDMDQDHLVTRAGEVMLRELAPGAATDLEGLRAMDENMDGIFSERDAAWHDFGIWRDANGNGICESDEFSTLEELEITAIGLDSDNRQEEMAGNTVHGHAVYTRADGTTGEVGDVALAGEEIEFTLAGDLEDTDLAMPSDADETDSGIVVVSDNDSQAAGEDGNAAGPGDPDGAEEDPASSDARSVALETEQGDAGAQPDTDGPGNSLVEAAETAMLADAGPSLPEPADGATGSDQGADLDLDLAEVNRLAQQLQSDVAAGPSAGEPVPDTAADVCSVDLHPDVAGHDDLLPDDDTLDPHDALQAAA